MILSQTGPAKYNRAVVLCGDENVVDYARFVFWQVAKNDPDRAYDLVFCTPVEGLDARHPRLPEIRVCEIDTASLQDMPTRPAIPIANHIKVALPEIFRNDYEQIIYLDTDVYLRHGKLTDLFSLADRDRPVAAILDGIQWHEKLYEFARQSWATLGIDNIRYFNAGVQLFNVEAYCSANIKDRVVEYAADNFQHFNFTDQDALNGVLRGNWHPLPLEWNWQASETQFRLIRKFDPHLLHFVGTSKPYITVKTPYTRRYRNTYVRFSEDILEKPFVPINRPENNVLAIRNQSPVQRILKGLDLVNPFSYTGLYRYTEVLRTRKSIEKIRAAIRNRTALWPPEARDRGDPDA